MNEIPESIQTYAKDIRWAARWYFDLWPRNRYYGVDDLIQAASIAVLNISRKHPEKLEIKAYVRAAIKYNIFNEIKKSVPKIRQLHLVRYKDEDVQLVDLLPVYDGHEEKIADLDDICHYISQNFSEEDADCLKELVDKTDITFDLNLDKLPSTDLKNKTRLVTKMDLDDTEMLMYAKVLIDAVDKFPRNYALNQKERAKKYISFVLDSLGVSPEEFALSLDREELLNKFKLHSFYQKAFNYSMDELFACICPDLGPHQIRGRNRWQGKEGLINGYNAIDWIRRKTGKKPEDLTQKDFYEFQLHGLLREWFANSMKKAIEFRYPDTYPQYSEEVKELWKLFLED